MGTNEDKIGGGLLLPTICLEGEFSVSGFPFSETGLPEMGFLEARCCLMGRREYRTVDGLPV
jgi:hypothetical protein